MTAPQRFFLWAGDGPLNARDQVVGHIETMIDEALREAEEDTCWLNELIAYLRCLNGVLRETGGDHDISQRSSEWRQRTLTAFDTMPSHTPDEMRDDRAFIVSVFDELEALTNS